MSSPQPEVTRTLSSQRRQVALHHAEEGERFVDPHDEEGGPHHRSPISSAHTLAEETSPNTGDKGEKGAKLGYRPTEVNWKDDIVLWESADDPANPLNWAMSKKYRVTLLLGATTLCSGFASSIFSSATGKVAKEFGVSPQIGIFGTSLFLLGYVPGPIIFGPMSEMYGRKLVYLPVFLFFCFTLATATSHTLSAVLVTRFFAGFFASGPVTTVGGGLADIFNTRERGSAVVLYSLAVVGGPTLAPVIGAAVSNSYLGWRWTQWLTAILTGSMFVVGMFLVPETNGPILLTRKASALRKRTGHWQLHSRLEMTDTSLSSILQKNLFRPLKMFVREPMVFSISLYNSFAYGVLYLLFAAVPIIFEDHKGWTPVQAALPFLAVFVGCLCAAAINHFYARYVFQPHLDRAEGQSRPEMRLPPMMLGGILFPVGFFLLGWAPTVGQVFGLGFVGCSFLLIFQGGINYLIDTYSVFGASAVAGNTFLRSFFAACLPFSASPMFGKLGIGGTCSLLGGIACVLAAVPFSFFVFGEKLRERSTFAQQANALKVSGQASGH